MHAMDGNVKLAAQAHRAAARLGPSAFTIILTGRTLHCVSLMTKVLSVVLKTKETANDFHGHQQ
jgi:hypothetical protein